MDMSMECCSILLLISFLVTIAADFTLPSNITVVDGSFYASTAMRVLIGADPPEEFTVMKAGLAEFPALGGKGVSYAVIQYPGGTLNPPHAHPWSSELLFLLTGSLVVGFIDNSSRLHVKTLQAGDMFVFPQGLVHYQYNNNQNEHAFALSAFGSANTGTVTVPGSVFTTGVSDLVLAKAFKTDIFTVRKIKTSLHQKPEVEHTSH